MAVAVLCFVCLLTSPAHAQQRSIAGSKFSWPTSEDVARVVFLRDYNTRIILLGTMLLGTAAGLVGAFMLLRKRALVGDVVSHASLPGIGVAFLVCEALDPGAGKSLPALLAGAAISGLLGILVALGIRRASRIKEDASLAIVLSLFFGIGVSLLTVIQRIPSGNTAGLNNFIYGKASSMILADVQWIAICAAIVGAICLAFSKELSLLCFDEDFAAAEGYPVLGLDVLLTVLVVGVTVVGLQSVGLLLVVAMLIMPGTAARFWTDQLGRLLFLSAGLGAFSAAAGVVLSALFPRLAAGAVIVLAGGLCFLFSLLFGTRRGVIRAWLGHLDLARRVGRHDLLRAAYECAAPDDSLDDLTLRPVRFDCLRGRRSWSPARLQGLLSRAAREGLVQYTDPSREIRFTELGASEAQRVVRNHRLWELFLITYADIAPSHVDRDADQIEHVLDPEIVAELEELMSHQTPAGVPPSPHAVLQPEA